MTYDVEYSEWDAKGRFLETVREDGLSFEEVQTLLERMEQGNIARLFIISWDINSEEK